MEYSSLETGEEEAVGHRDLPTQMTRQECEELAKYFGFSAKLVTKIRSSKSGAGYHIAVVKDELKKRRLALTNSSMVMYALQDLGMDHIVSFIQSTADEHSQFGKADTCVCGEDFQFYELRSKDKTVGVRCKNDDCGAEWLLVSTETVRRGFYTTFQNEDYKYKRPQQLDFVRHERLSERSELNPGDHISMPRLFGVYYHHAIVLESTDKDKMEVINWTTGSLRSAMGYLLGLTSRKPVLIERESRDRPATLKRAEYAIREDDFEVVMARAKQLESERQHYHPTDNNCESFATFCKVGRCYSVQGQHIKDIMPPIAAVAVSSAWKCCCSFLS